MGDRYLEYMPLAEVRPNDRNPKDHDLVLIGRSYEEFGYTEPVVLDERTGTLLSGHGRVEELADRQAHDLPAPDGIRVEDDGTWSVPVIRGVTTKDDAQADAYLVAANRITEAGGWLDDPLADILRGLSDSSPHLFAVTGFLDAELTDMLARLSGPPDLDDLSDKYGDPDERDLWPFLRVQVSPALMARFTELVTVWETDEAGVLGHLMTLADEAIRRDWTPHTA